MRINVAVPERHVKPPVLNAALEAVTRLNQSLIKNGAPTSWDLLRKGHIWKPEPPGQEHFDHVGILARRGHGDCDDWAPLHAASLRESGQDPGARAVVRRTGPKRWHATVIRSNGQEDDPSRKAGMGRRGSLHGCNGAVLPTMFDPQPGVNGAYALPPQLALRPVPDKWGDPTSWQARADVPWHVHHGISPGDVAMAALHQSPMSDQALVGACRGIVGLARASGSGDTYSIDRMNAIADMCEGASWEECAINYGTEHADAASHVVGGFFGSLLKKAKKLAGKGLKLVPDLISFVPGVGPAASMAIKAASPMLAKALKQGKHVRPQHRALAHPGRAFRSIPRGSKVYKAPPMRARRGQGQPFICYPQ